MLVMVAAWLAVTVVVKVVTPQPIETGAAVSVSPDTETAPVLLALAEQLFDDVAVAVSV